MGVIRAGWFGLRSGAAGHRQRAGDADGSATRSGLLTAGGASRYWYAMSGIRNAWAALVSNGWYSRVIGHMRARVRPIAVARRSPGSEAMPAVSGALSTPGGATAGLAAAPQWGLTSIVNVTRAESREPRAVFMCAGARHVSAERMPVRPAAWLPSFRAPRGAVRPASDRSGRPAPIP